MLIRWKQASFGPNSYVGYIEGFKHHVFYTNRHYGTFGLVLNFSGEHRDIGVEFNTLEDVKKVAEEILKAKMEW